MKSFITSQFNYCPIVWMCHGNNLKNLTIHKKNLQLLAIEFFNVKMNTSPEIMNKIFHFSKNYAYQLRCRNFLSR